MSYDNVLHMFDEVISASVDESGWRPGMRQ